MMAKRERQVAASDDSREIGASMRRTLSNKKHKSSKILQEQPTTTTND